MREAPTSCNICDSSGIYPTAPNVSSSEGTESTSTTTMFLAAAGGRNTQQTPSARVRKSSVRPRHGAGRGGHLLQRRHREARGRTLSRSTNTGGDTESGGSRHADVVVFYRVMPSRERERLKKLSCGRKFPYLRRWRQALLRTRDVKDMLRILRGCFANRPKRL